MEHFRLSSARARVRAVVRATLAAARRRCPAAWAARAGLCATLAAGLTAGVQLAASAAPAAAREPATQQAGSARLRPVCALAGRRQARCLALEEAPGAAVTAGASAAAPAGAGAAAPAGASAASSSSERCHVPSPEEGCYGLRPQDLHSAYDLPGETEASASQTIAIVAYDDDPTIKTDLRIYDGVFELPACTVSDRCLSVVNEQGKRKPLPQPNGQAAREESLDVEMAHAICQNCHILLVEASSPKIADLEAAEDAAAAAGATEISNSWAMVGEGQPAEPPEDSAAFDHPGVVVTAAAGDWGYLNDGLEADEQGANYPASSPHVIAVGGTRLQAGAEGEWRAETVWNTGADADGSGCSSYFEAPPWQLTLTDWFEVGCGDKRAVADVSAAAEASVEGDPHPYTGVAVYDSTPLVKGQKESDWHTLYGTSAATPLIAAAFALAGGSHGVEFPARTLYESEIRDQGALHDVVSGSDGACARGSEPETHLPRCGVPELAASCEGALICQAGEGYDGPTGVGTPDGLGAFEVGAQPVTKPQRLRFTSTPPEQATVGAAEYAVSAESSSGLAVSLSSTTPSVCELSNSLVSFVGAGTCTIQAEQPGDSEFQAAPALQQSFAVAAAPPPVTLPLEPVTPGPETPSGHGQALSFNSSQPPSDGAGDDSRITLLTQTRPSARGLIGFALSLASPGRLTWTIELANRVLRSGERGRPQCAFGRLEHRRCRPLELRFTAGARTLEAAGSIHLSMGPQRRALSALERAAKLGLGLAASARFSFTSSLGGSSSLSEPLRFALPVPVPQSR